MAKSTPRVGLRELKQFLATVGAEERAMLDKGADLAEDAYWYQRAARTRYPGADGVLNLTPYVGVATNVDDIQRSIRDSGDVEAGDIGGLLLNATLTAKYGKMMKATPAFAQRVADDVKRASKGKRGHGAVPSLTAAALYAPVEYVKHYYNAQQEANEKYGDMTLSEIAAELERLSNK